MQKPIALTCGFALLCSISQSGRAHEIGHDDEAHPHYDASVVPPPIPTFLAAAPAAARAAKPVAPSPAIAAMFAPFADKVRVRWDENSLYLESDAMPDHKMMLGITAWQQQVPLPQPYVGDNAWRVPLAPTPAKVPLSAKTNFFRGAIALAANGVPIFNPIKNDGRTDTFLAGELDTFGGHAGRADDYHYHIAPLHLQTQLGPNQPIAVALDGYAIYGLAENDGTPPSNLDAFGGHTMPALGYHYHSSKSYPYINGGFHGEVALVGGQVDPQPNARPVRPATTPLRGATITDFSMTPDGKNFDLRYSQNGKIGSVRYAIEGDGTYKFQYLAADGQTSEQTYAARPDGANKEGRGRRNRGNGENLFGTFGEGENTDAPRAGRDDNAGRPTERPTGPRGGPNPNDPNRKPWIADHFAEMDADKDGVLTRAEMTGEIEKTFAGYDRDQSGAITQSERDARGVRSAMGGFVNAHWAEVDADNSGQITLAELSGVGQRMFDKADRNRDDRLAPDELGAPPAPREDRNAGNRGGTKTEPPRANNAALVKPTMSDTMATNIYADNWFALYINGELRVVDPIAFLPHNVVSVDILPEYPMTIAVVVHDNADPKTGLEYGNQIGDGGFVLKFADGTVTDGSWKALAIESGPLGGDVANPRVQKVATPARWFAPDFDDSKWPAARVFSEAEVAPKAPFYEHDFKGAQFIWSNDLALDNTVLLRTTVVKPNWKARWNVRPDGPLPAGF